LGSQPKPKPASPAAAAAKALGGCPLKIREIRFIQLIQQNWRCILSATSGNRAEPETEVEPHGRGRTPATEERGGSGREAELEAEAKPSLFT